MPRYAVNSHRISSERLGDEVILIDASSGAYYSGAGPVADAWTLLAAGVDVDDAVARLAALYGVPEEGVRTDTLALVDFLVAREIFKEAEPSAIAEMVELPDMDRSSWTLPSFEEYTDMWDLLKADPIHDVGEAGWPYAMPTPKE